MPTHATDLKLTLARKPTLLLFAALLVGGLTADVASARNIERAQLVERGGAVKGVSTAVRRARADLRARLGIQGLLEVDGATGSIRSLARLDGQLTGPSDRPGAAVALAYMHANRDAFGLGSDDLDGLKLVRSYKAGGIEHLAWAQNYRGIQSIDTSLKANLDRSGALLNILGPVAPGLFVPSTKPRLTAAQAYKKARAAADGTDRAFATDSENDAAITTTFSDGGRGSLAIYREGTEHRLAWRLLVPVSSTGVYDMVIDARTGKVVRRANRVNFASALAYDNHPGAAAGGTQVSKDITAFLNGGATTLIGDNSHAFSDVDDAIPGPSFSNFTPAAGDEVAPSSGNWNYTFTPFAAGCTSPGCAWNETVANSWATNRAQDVTQTFFFVNNFHDHLKNTPQIDFNEASGNFETDNGANGGTGGDAILAQAMDGADTGAGGFPDSDHINNANMLTLNDGFPGLMQMYLWGGTWFDNYSSADDASIIYHEYTHGLSNRLITDSAGFGALNSQQSGSMGEAWADWYAIDYLVAQGLETDGATDGELTLGAYIDEGGNLIRTQAIDCNPASIIFCADAGGGAGAGGYTYGDFGTVYGTPEVHGDGEIWAQTLWQLRRALIGAHGASTGTARARQYITSGMRLAPEEPSFLDMRNAILIASTADDALIWSVFAQRGMGVFAMTDDANDVTPTQDFSLPPAPGDPVGTVAGTVTVDGVGTGGVLVYFGGGLGPELTATSTAGGAYSIASVPVGTYPTLNVGGSNALERKTVKNVNILDASTTTVDFATRHDYASSSSGATIASYTGPNYAAYGCGPDGLIDDTRQGVWGSDAGPDKQNTVNLGQTIDIDDVRIDPTAGCGDTIQSSLGSYDVEASGDGATFTQIATGTFNNSNLNKSNAVALTGNLTGRNHLRLTAKTTQGSSGTGNTYLDVAELEVYTTAATPAPPSRATAAATSIGQSSAQLNGSVNPNGTATNYKFEYGTTTAYGNTTPTLSAGAGDLTVSANAAISSLSPGTTYHFRLVATRGSTAYTASDQTFTTVAATAPSPDPSPSPANSSGGDAAGAGPGGTGNTSPSSLTDAGPEVFFASLDSPKVSKKGAFEVKLIFAAHARAGKGKLYVFAGKTAASTATGSNLLLDLWAGIAATAKPLASRTFKIVPGATKTIKLKLTRKGKQAIRRKRKLTVTLVARYTANSGAVKLSKLVSLKKR